VMLPLLLVAVLLLPPWCCLYHCSYVIVMPLLLHCYGFVITVVVSPLLSVVVLALALWCYCHSCVIVLPLLSYCYSFIILVVVTLLQFCYCCQGVAFAVVSLWFVVSLLLLQCHLCHCIVAVIT
jgi:hypothetical protein